MHPATHWNEVEALQKTCEQHDGIALKLNWDTLLSRKPNDGNDLAEYRDGKLVAFLGRYPFGSTMEVCGMVHPDYRRQGIFAGLLQRAMDDPAILPYSKLLLNAPGNSESAKKFLARVSCVFSFTEYQMCHAADSGLPASPGPAVTLRDALKDDLPLLAELDHEGFRIDADETRLYYEEMSAEEIAKHELIVVSGEPVGKIRVARRDGESWIYGFVVLARHRGQGIGSTTLHQIIERERAAGYEVWLEVALDNAHAKKLYENAGFQVRRSQDYYAYLR
ncbi:GNAT family N-acetyltransferase [Paenibacillus macerans]|uniref:GNAT family N-acetyltransferase n=1 Tax=Paenibacillus macerans TaxID=44252 RepID=UPI003D316484